MPCDSMVSDITSRLLFTLLACLTSASLYKIIYYVITTVAYNQSSSSKGCKPPSAYPQIRLLLGVDLIRDVILAVRSKCYLMKIQQSYRQYGNTFSKNIFFTRVICTIEPENIKAVLSTNFNDYGITSVRKNAFNPLLGQNILTANGGEWVRARAMLRPSFSKDHYNNLAMFEIHVKHLMKAIRRNGPTIGLKDLFLCLTADVTTHSMYGESIDSLNSSSLTCVMEAFTNAQYGCEERARWGKFAVLVPQPRFYKSIKILQNYMQVHIKKYLQYEGVQESLQKVNHEGHYILLHELGKVLRDKVRLRNELLTIFFAGRDTTASLLSSLFLTLAHRPHIWSRLRNEVEYLKGENPTLEQLKQMQYFKHCLNESE